MVKKVVEEPKVIGCRKSAQVSCKDGEFRDVYRDGYCQSKRTIRDKNISMRNRQRLAARKAQAEKIVVEHEEAIMGK